MPQISDTVVEAGHADKRLMKSAVPGGRHDPQLLGRILLHLHIDRVGGENVINFDQLLDVA